MSTENPAAGKPANSVSLEQWMAARHGQIANALLAAAAVFAALPIWQFIRARQDKDYVLALGAWGFLIAITCLFGAMYLKLAEPADIARDQTRYRLLALGIGGSVGLITFLAGIWLPMGEWAYAFIPPAAKGGDETIPLLRQWRENWWRILVCAVAVMGGLALMFASLRLAKQVERASAGMRRLLYAYNAVLTGLLLLASLGLLNVLSYVQLPPFTVFDQQIDWTPSQMYTLSDKSVALLKNELPGSIEIFALMSPRMEFARDVETLYKNCKRYKKDIDFAFYSPDSDPTGYAKVRAKYNKFLDSQGLGLIVVYQGQDGKEEAGGIKVDELLNDKPGLDPNAPPRYTFKGENSLMKLLRKLSDSKPAKIVFTKGHGELEFQPPMSREERGKDLSELKKRLEGNRNYEFSEATLGVEGNTGLADADIVVIANPTRAYPPQAIQAIRDYLNPRGTAKKGKMIVMLSKQVRDDQMLKTNLEDVLRENGVEISNKRMLAGWQQPGTIAVTTPMNSTNPVARAFSGGSSVKYWGFREPRRMSAPKGDAMSRNKVEPILVTDSELPVWEEADLISSPVDLLNQYRNPNLPKEKRPLVDSMMWAAVAVSEGKPMAGMPQDPTHAGVTDQVPRMVVFGDSSWITTDIALRDRGLGADLFDSCVGWLRGKADLGSENYAEDKERPQYSLAAKGLTAGKLSRVVWLPLALIFLAVLALGGGIWVVRRR